MSKAHILSGSGIVLAAALAGLAPGGQAQAADMLRGPYAGDQQPSRATVADWGGIYAGVHVGASVGTADPRRFASTHRNALTASPAMPVSIAATVSGMVGLRDTSATKFSYGAFIGANWQWDDVVLGIEGDYTRSDLRLRNSTTSAQTYSPAAGTEYDLRVTSTSNVRVQDWATLRARIGWSAGMFMPYITGGFALGSVRSQTSANAAWDRYSTVVLPRTYVDSGSVTSVLTRNGIAFGHAIGAGIDMQLMPGAFLRGEYLNVRFNSSTTRPQVSIHTFRVAGAVKY